MGKYKSSLANIIPLFKGDTNHFHVNEKNMKLCAVSVSITGGGAVQIRVTDNGSGFERDDLDIAFQKNTTSKIRCADDLMSVQSLGFRGEALSSISAVSKLELLTKTKDELVGIRYVIHGGAVFRP